jgi:hypothetical protein
MTKGTKVALILGGIAAVGAGVFFYIRSTKPTEDMFNEWKRKSLAAGQDIFEGAGLEQHNKMLDKWKKNLTKKEAQSLIDNTKKNSNEDMLKPLLEKLIGHRL